MPSFQPIIKMKLYSKRLLLRSISIINLYDLYQLQSNEAVARYNTIGIPEDVNFTQTLIENAVNDPATFDKTNFWWGIFLKESNQFIGEAGLNLSVTRYKSGEVFYGLYPDYWGKGYATEAVETILTYGFVDLSLHRISAGVATENEASIKLLERVGMTREGKHRKILPIRGEWWDNYGYAILEEDFFLQNDRIIPD